MPWVIWRGMTQIYVYVYVLHISPLQLTSFWCHQPKRFWKVTGSQKNLCATLFNIWMQYTYATIVELFLSPIVCIRINIPLLWQVNGHNPTGKQSHESKAMKEAVIQRTVSKNLEVITLNPSCSKNTQIFCLCIHLETMSHNLFGQQC